MFEYVKDPKLTWPKGRTKRDCTKGIVIHHTANRGVSSKTLHQNALNQGWNGFPYNFYVRLDGTIWEGRGLEYIGSHAGRKHVRNDKEWAAGAHNNNETVGIGFEGHYHPSSSIKPDTKMPAAQFNAGVRLIQDLLEYYGDDLFIKGHRDMPSTSTACPGDYFPFDELVREARNQSAKNMNETEPKPEEVADVHVVKKGETFSKIAAQYGMNVKELLSYNPHIKDPGAVKVGDKIYLEENSELFLKRVIKVKSPLMKGDDVLEIQTRLNNTIKANLKTDGKYGNGSASAVKKFQKSKGLKADGIVGKDTCRALEMEWVG